MSRLSTILNTLHAHLQGLREDGVRTVPVRDSWAPPRPGPASPAPSSPSRPPQGSAAGRTPAPPPSPATPPPAETTVALVWCRLERLAECGDARPAGDTSLALVLESSEWKGDNGDLLRKMLHAIGYAPVTQPESLPDLPHLWTQGARVVCLGDAALQTLSPMKMPLKLVRGKWLKTPAGKLLATYGPGYLNRNQPAKKAAWEDLQLLLADLDLTIPSWTRQRGT